MFPMPNRIRRLPKTLQGYPALFFAAIVDGKVNIHKVSAAKFHRCVKEKLCWLCGESLSDTFTFVLTASAAEARIWTEPPCHTECAEYALSACPFIVDPERRYRNGRQQPEAYELYTTRYYQCSELRNAYPIGTFTLGPRL